MGPELEHSQEETIMPKETDTPTFLELELQGGENPWCVDGRPDPSKNKGPQMLGGSFHPVLLSAIVENSAFNSVSLQHKLAQLQEKGFGLGVHRGSHKHPEQGTCDCGFADRMPHIVQTAIDRRAVITERLGAVYEQNRDKIGEFAQPFADLLNQAYDTLASFNVANIQLTGEQLIGAAEQVGSQVEDVQGDHAEAVAFLNLKPNTTLDTNELNKQGRQGFNLDLWAAVEQAQALDVDQQFALMASLILYVATEMVLVEDKGKPALSVAIHA